MIRKKPNKSVADASRAVRPRGLASFAAALARGESPPDDGGRFLNHPDFTATLVAAFHRELSTQLAPKALRVLDGLLASENEKIRLAAAKTVLDKALPDVRQAGQAAPGEDLNSMSVDQLAAMVDKLESELAGRAHDVSIADNAANSAADKAKVLAMLD